MIRKYRVAKFICGFLPPILAQSVRNQIISIKEGELLNLDFKKKSITGSSFIGNTSDFHAFKFSVHGYFDWRNVLIANEVLKYYEGGDILEVGANIGTETVSFADIAKLYKSQVFAFEPLKSNMDYLILNKSENNLENLKLFNCLISNKPGSAYFNIPKGNNSGSGFISNTHTNGNSEKFEVKTLDGIVKDNKTSLICVDVEGFEYQVLKGSLKIIKRDKPVLILEVNKRYLENRGQIDFKTFCDYITILGYDCYSIGKLGISKVNFNNHKTHSNKNWVCIAQNDTLLYQILNNKLRAFAITPCAVIN